MSRRRRSLVRWRLIRHVIALEIRRRLAYLVPRSIATFVFIRVYACIGETGPDYLRVLNAWEDGAGR